MLLKKTKCSTEGKKWILTSLFIANLVYQPFANAQTPPPRGSNGNPPNQNTVPNPNPQRPNPQNGNNNPVQLALPLPRLLEPNPEQLALQNLGRQIFFDVNLSNPVGQSCASCHLPEAGFADLNSSIATSEGAIAGLFGNRNSPTVSYSQFIPPFQNNNNQGGGNARGGLFLDGRANSLEEQAKAPFLNALEMNNESEEAVITGISAASYAEEFKAIFGANSLLNTSAAFDQVGVAIAAFERSNEVSPFTSRFDTILQGNESPSASEIRGFQLFTGRAGCVRCHNTNNGQVQVFSDFSYQNVGVPANPDNLFYSMAAEFNPQGNNFIDQGLGAVTGVPRQNGQFRVPSLRNVGLTAPYMHNGVFNTLEEVVEFYNTRDVNSEQFPAEVSANVSRRGGIGNLGLSDNEIQDIVQFLRALSDQTQ